MFLLWPVCGARATFYASHSHFGFYLSMAGGVGRVGAEAAPGGRGGKERRKQNAGGRGAPPPPTYPKCQNENCFFYTVNSVAPIVTVPSLPCGFRSHVNASPLSRGLTRGAVQPWFVAPKRR